MLETPAEDPNMAVDTDTGSAAMEMKTCQPRWTTKLKPKMGTIFMPKDVLSSTIFIMSVS